MRLQWTPLAARHLESAYEYLAEQNAEAAVESIERILSAVGALERHPQMGRKGRVSGTREFVITGTPFVIASRLRRDQVQILAVLHGARRWPDRF